MLELGFVTLSALLWLASMIIIVWAAAGRRGGRHR